MINGLGVLGWGVGGIEAEAAMLGQPMSMLIPHVVGFKLDGELPEGATATDLVLTVTADAAQARRRRQVRRVLRPRRPEPAAGRPRDDRQHVARSSARPARSSRSTRRRCATSSSPAARRSSIELVEAYAKEQGLWHDEDSEEPTYSETLELDLGDVVPSLAGPKRPQDRVSLTEAKASFRMALEDILPEPSSDGRRRGGPRSRSPPRDPPGARTATASGHDPHAEPRRRRHRRRAGRRPHRASPSPVTLADGTETELDHGHVVIAAITSCTNTSNPSVMLGAGLLARNAVERGPDSPSRG